MSNKNARGILDYYLRNTNMRHLIIHGLIKNTTKLYFEKSLTLGFYHLLFCFGFLSVYKAAWHTLHTNLSYQETMAYLLFCLCNSFLGIITCWKGTVFFRTIKSGRFSRSDFHLTDFVRHWHCRIYYWLLVEPSGPDGISPTFFIHFKALFWLWSSIPVFHHHPISFVWDANPLFMESEDSTLTKKLKKT